MWQSQLLALSARIIDRAHAILDQNALATDHNGSDWIGFLRSLRHVGRLDFVVGAFYCHRCNRAQLPESRSILEMRRVAYYLRLRYYANWWCDNEHRGCDHLVIGVHFGRILGLGSVIARALDDEILCFGIAVGLRDDFRFDCKSCGIG